MDKANVHPSTMPGSPHLGLSAGQKLLPRPLAFACSVNVEVKIPTPGSRNLRPSMSATQELPKYLRGFHKCSREDAVHLAGLIYRVQFGSDRSQLASVSKILKELVPQNLTRLMSSEEWKKVFDGIRVDGQAGWLGTWAACTWPFPVLSSVLLRSYPTLTSR